MAKCGGSSKNKLKVLFVLDHCLMHYRVPLFQHLCQVHVIVIMHRGPLLDGEFAFEQRVVKYRKVGPFEVVDHGKLEEFDVVVLMQNMRLVPFWNLPVSPRRKQAVVFWGIGVSSSGGLSKQNRLIAWLRSSVTSFSDGVGFYSEFPLSYYSEKVLSKAVVLGNSVCSPLHEDLSGSQKDSFLFIGALNRRKGIPMLLSAFSKYLSSKPDSCSISKLRVVGEGEMRDELRDVASSLGIERNVVFEGDVRDPVIKKSFFKSAAACVSPLQAGLSVVESFSYGVPFVTHQNPITGGEYLSIEDGVNGFLFDNEEELLRQLLFMAGDEAGSRRLGEAAYQTYISKLRIEGVVCRFDSLIRDSYSRFDKRSRGRGGVNGGLT